MRNADKMYKDYMVDFIEVGKRIAKMRKNVGLTQEKLAEKVGLERNTIAQVEKGGLGLSLESVLAICKVLKIDTNYLLSGVVKNFDEVERVAEKLHILQKQEYLGMISGFIDVIADVAKS